MLLVVALSWAQVPPPIVGGAATSDYPEVPLLVLTATNRSQAICTGSLVDPEWVLTAAHCVSNSQGFTLSTVDVYFGSSINRLEAQVRADDWTANPSYNPQTGYYDVAMVHLSKAVTNQDIMTIAPETLNAGDKGELFRITGWGITSDTDQGQNTAKHFVDLPLYTYDSKLMVTYDQKNNKNACHGDSGGPVMRLYDDGTYAQTGIVNFAYDSRDGSCEGTGVANARVDFYLSWIKTFTDVTIHGDGSDPTPETTDAFGPVGDNYPGEALGPADFDDPQRPADVGEDYTSEGNCSSVGTTGPWALFGLAALLRRRRKV